LTLIGKTFVFFEQGIAQLLERLTATAHCPKRTHNDAFYMAVDHCFAVKGQGTVLTGTVLNGSIEVGQVSISSTAHFFALLTLCIALDSVCH
jgi:selenocysteine-specific translation elongation factor